MTQLSKKCGLAANTISEIFTDRSIYYDNKGRYRIEKRVYEKDINKMVSEFLSTHEFGEFGGSLRTYGTIIDNALEDVEKKLDNDVDEYASPTLDQDVGFKVLAEVLKAVQYGLMHLKDKMDPSSPLESVYLNGTPSDDPSDDRRNRIYQRLVTKLSPAMAPPGVTVHPAPPYYHLKKSDGSIPVLADF